MSVIHAMFHHSSLRGTHSRLFKYWWRDHRNKENLRYGTKLICSLCEAGNLSQDVNGVLVHVVENYSEGKAALVECAHTLFTSAASLKPQFGQSSEGAAQFDLLR